MTTRIVDRLASAELLLLCLIAPSLLFPRGLLPLAGLLAVLVLWLARLFRRTRTLPTPLDLPMLILLAMTVESLYPSVDLSLSLPKLYGITLGVAVYYGVVVSVGSRRTWWVAIRVLMVAAVVVATVGLVSTKWITFKLPGGPDIYRHIPRLVSSVPSSFGSIAGIQPNELGGTLAFLLPIPIALFVWALWPPRPPVSHSPRLPITVAALLTLLLVTPVLVLAQSRSSMVGLAVAVGLLVGIRWRRLGQVELALVVIGAIFVGLVARGAVSSWIVHLDYVGDAGAKLIDREDIWSRAVNMIQDFPFTGIGLNTFPIVLDNLYPSFLEGPNVAIPHAHDIYLQTAVDLGIAGLMAFVGLWLIVGWQTVKAYRKMADPMMRGAVVGLAAGCAAYLAYGLTDAITLGAKPLVLLWVMVGLIVAAGRLRPDLEGGRGGEKEIELAPALTQMEIEYAAEAPTQNPVNVPEGTFTPRTQTPSSISRSSAFSPWWRRWAIEIGRLLWTAYWMVAVLFAGIAYLIVGSSMTGWMR